MTKRRQTMRRLATTDGAVRRLAAAIERIEGARQTHDPRPVGSGFAALDRLLPAGGLRRGTIVEYLAAGNGSGATSLALAAARSAMSSATSPLAPSAEAPSAAGSGVLVVVDRQRTFYPPAAAAWGVALDQLIVVWPQNHDDERWALDQALRCAAVAAVLAWPAEAEGNDFRRWQLAAEAGGSLGLFVRPDAVRNEPSWAEARLAVAPNRRRRILSPTARGQGSIGERIRLPQSSPHRLPPFSSHHLPQLSPQRFPPFSPRDPPLVPRRTLRVELLKCRGRAAGAVTEIVIDDATHPLPVAERLVAPMAKPPRRARA